jgi:uncharacterized protein YbjT (DUF2867 family)
MAQKSRILIIGGTGDIGKFIVAASAKAGHPTFALIRESTRSDPVKGKLVENFKNLGVTLLHVSTYTSFCLFYIWFVLLVSVCMRVPFVSQGDLHDHGSLVKAIKQVDVVISTVGRLQFGDQVKIIAAIKEAGNVKVASLNFTQILTSSHQKRKLINDFKNCNYKLAGFA